MKKSIFIICTVLVFSMIVGAVGYTFTAPRKYEVKGIISKESKYDLICDSEVIVSGKVNKILPSRWSNEDYKKGKNVLNIIQTDISIEINDIFKGNPYDNKNIIVRINKGKVGNKEMESEGFPDFEVGEEVILFLSKDDSDIAEPNENYYVLTGMKQGKYSFKETRNNDKIFSYDTNEISLLNFNNEIRESLEKEKKNPRPKLPLEQIREESKKYLKSTK